MVGIALAAIPTEQFFSEGSIAAVIVISLPAFYGLWKLYGKKALYTIAALGVFSLTIESIGIHTGFPYSHFSYTLPMGAQLFGTTPWTVVIAWSPLVIGAYVLAHKVFKQSWSRFLIYLGILLASDTVLDPGAVARGLWAYDKGGVFYGVPFENFLGWIFSGTLAYIIIRIILAKKKAIDSSVFESIAVSSLLLSLALWSGVNLAYEQYLPAVIGMVLLLLLGSVLRWNRCVATTTQNELQE